MNYVVPLSAKTSIKGKREKKPPKKVDAKKMGGGGGSKGRARGCDGQCRRQSDQAFLLGVEPWAPKRWFFRPLMLV